MANASSKSATTPKAEAKSRVPKVAAPQRRSAPVTAGAVRRPAKTAAKAKGANGGIPAEQRAHYIEVAAYYIAQRRGFTPGDAMEDWLAAEAEIDDLLREGRLG